MRGKTAIARIGLRRSPQGARPGFAFVFLLCAPAFADPASTAERALFCRTIGKGLEEEAADMALDEKACLANGSVQSNARPDGKREIKGRLGFRAPGRPAFALNCAATYAPPLTKKTVATLGACE